MTARPWASVQAAAAAAGRGPWSNGESQEPFSYARASILDVEQWPISSGGDAILLPRAGCSVNWLAVMPSGPERVVVDAVDDCWTLGSSV